MKFSLLLIERSVAQISSYFDVHGDRHEAMESISMVARVYVLQNLAFN